MTLRRCAVVVALLPTMAYASSPPGVGGLLNALVLLLLIAGCLGRVWALGGLRRGSGLALVALLLLPASVWLTSVLWVGDGLRRIVATLILANILFIPAAVGYLVGYGRGRNRPAPRAPARPRA